jgi:oligogalacturonide transport system substrate-binding protein
LPLPQTWDDFFADAEIMSKDGVYPLGLGDKACFFFTLAYMEQTTGHKACNEDGELVITRDDIKVMLEFYKRLFDEKVIPQVDQYNLNYFLSGKCAGVMGWVSDADNYCKVPINEGKNIVIGEYPTFDGAKGMGWYIKPATLYAISKNTDEPEEAARLLDYLINSSEMARLQKFEKGVPISDKAQQTLEDDGLTDGMVYEANKKMSDRQDDMSVIAPVLEAENVYIAFKDEANYYLYDKKSLDEVADMVYKDFYNTK